MMMMIEDFLYNKKIYYLLLLSFIYLEKTSLERTQLIHHTISQYPKKLDNVNDSNR